MEVITRTPGVQVPQIAWNLLAELPENESDLVVGRRVDCICAPLFVLCRHHRALLRLSRSLLRHRRMVRLLDLWEVLCIVFGGDHASLRRPTSIGPTRLGIQEQASRTVAPIARTCSLQ